jgi:hypothetical protein
LESKKGRTEEEEKRLKELKKVYEKEAKNEIENSLKNLKVNFSEVEEDKDLTLDNVLAVYRNLRENYDYHLKYDESGRLFTNEMRLRKRFLKSLKS